MNANTNEIEFPQYLHMDPLYDNEQINRYQRIKQTTTQLQEMSKFIKNYISSGKKFAQAISDLHNVMSQIDIVAINAQYSSLCNSIITMNSIVLSHLNHVESAMHIPVESFIRHDISMMKKSKASYVQIHGKFTEAYDKLANPPKKSRDTTDKRQKLMELHKQSSHAFCEYILQLDVTESRYANLIGSLLISYSASVYNELASQINRLAKLEMGDIQIVSEKITQSNEAIAQKMFENTAFHQTVEDLIPQYYGILDQPYQGTPKSEIQGYLWRKTSVFGSSWDKLFCMSRDGFFAASTSPATCAKPLWTLQLEYCNVKPFDLDDKPNCLTIISKNKNIVLQAPSLYDRDKWIATIQSQISSKFMSQDMESARLKENNTSTCADCGARDSDWIITNKGAILCSKCAGIHRSLPMSVSRIRSLTMDTNDLYCMELLKAIGNKGLNEILEANVVDKINPDSTQEEREAFIKRKYVDLEFISKDPVDLRSAIQNSVAPQILKAVLTGEINQDLPDGLTALQAASIVGSPPIVCLIAMNCPEMIDKMDRGMWTALDYATFYNHVYVVDALLTYGANPMVEEAVKPYVIAASKKLDDIAMLLSSARPESFEISEYSPPSEAFKPSQQDTSMFRLTVSRFDSGSSPAFSQTDPSMFVHKRRMTLIPKKMPFKINTNPD
ncbi:hypothetical protein TVAG_485110 [Trichomonas vaginalis G3]|uniref:ARF GAP-like zinc finger-containing protein n=1 Tax=Trichomonas vaginalis (strain ATCC PRA-98 / G3) TaxID=412133 RepID=A2EZ27_TRIV3|nr:GTPase activator protein [Trichomonas vaginalis G3]EAY02076.1 hypothetical protein TVAG_485110 [Trichomonas vaginalis G3]KAI5512740.1 GTPase activator protein [Trichomonas vaginalis G3]|eukprot:XP_001330529.1 hypothetical protein [Trichomonas vaginalis G3]